VKFKTRCTGKWNCRVSVSVLFIFVHCLKDKSIHTTKKTDATFNKMVIRTWVNSEVLHTVCFLFKNEFILQNTFTGLQCNLHCALSQRSNVYAHPVFLFTNWYTIELKQFYYYFRTVQHTHIIKNLLIQCGEKRTHVFFQIIVTLFIFNIKKLY
jgi:hypothetical protein